MWRRTPASVPAREIQSDLEREQSSGPEVGREEEREERREEETTGGRMSNLAWTELSQASM